MRIVSGKNKGRNLLAPKGGGTRPTSDRTRESVFNILHSLLEGGFDGLTVVDLFAGTGAFGLEALSRGAEHALFVDSSYESIQIIDKNIRTCEMESHVTLKRQDATNLGPFNLDLSLPELVFLDPPYRGGLITPALDSLQKNKWLEIGALCVVESSSVERLECPANFEQVVERNYGKATIYILRFKH